MNKQNFHSIKIKVIGVGGAGCNAVEHMIDQQIEGVEFVAVNTDSQALLASTADLKINIGADTLKGIGAGGEPDIGEKAAKENEKDIREILENTDLLFLVCGLGGGTGTGATPVIAKIAQELEILTIATVTRPFNFEGRFRVANADKGIQNLKKLVDSMIIIANDKLLENHGNSSLENSFNHADETLRLAIQTVSDLIVLPARINLDFADIKKVFSRRKNAMFGIGVAEGKHKAVDATREAVNCKLLEASVKGVKNAIVSYTGGSGTSLLDVNDSIEFLKKQAGEEVNVIFGLRINREMGDKMMVAIIGTDFDEGEIQYADPDTISKIRKQRDLEEKIGNKDNSMSEDDSFNNNKATEGDNSDFPNEEDDDLPPFMKGE